MCDTEIWTDVHGFEGLYKISNMGRLKSYKVAQVGSVMKTTNKKGDYIRVVLEGVGFKRKTISIHRLVAIHFIPNPNNYDTVNHIDGNKQNNKYTNLEWTSQSSNTKHSREILHRNQLNGMIEYNKTQRAKKISCYDKTGKLLRTYESPQEASLITGICKRNILQVAKGNMCRHTAGGYIWKYSEGGDVKNGL